MSRLELQMSEENNWSKWYKGFCEECQNQKEIFHSAYLGIEVCADCYSETRISIGCERIKI